ncbi:hypothetical protein EW145_g6946 [Phellinidium pouzarii]|uniref:NAD-dependent epimerase/dehydratase domain-containing protein n=1 Tax=Phellinidium pouzarii TaxID=167371 RepID=A0A4V3XBA6_9AGAM|nr:hypothetical protein EW145_g6946 [Phellinidium pouzarii]
MVKTVFILGATGYIGGGSLLVSLKKTHPDLVYKALVRSESDIIPVGAAGATPVHRSFTDHNLIAEHCAHADIVVNAADSDDIQLTNAVLRGLKRRKEEGRGIAVLIHTSGDAIFNDNGKEGKHNPNMKVWTDSEEDIRSLTPSMIHGQVDVPVLKAAEEGYANSFILCPSIVYGRGSGPVKRITILVRLLLESSKVQPYRRVHYVGEGTNINALININDLIEAYLLIFKFALDAGHTLLPSNPYARYYNASAIPVAWKDLTRALAGAFHKKGLVNSPEPISVSYEDAGSANWYLAFNVPIRTKRLLELGWKPVHRELTNETFAEDVDEILKEN